MACLPCLLCATAGLLAAARKGCGSVNKTVQPRLRFSRERSLLTSSLVLLQATSGHLGMLKAKLAKLRRELLDPSSGGGGGGGGRGDGFDVNKVGDARVGLVGAQLDCGKPA